MDAFWAIDMEVPEVICVGRVGPRVLFMAPIHRREFDWVSNEENGLMKDYESAYKGVALERRQPYLIVENPVVIALSSLELDSKSSEISNCIC